MENKVKEGCGLGECQKYLDSGKKTTCRDTCEYRETSKDRVQTEDELRQKMFEYIEQYKTFAAAIFCVGLAKDYYLNVHEHITEEEWEPELIDSREWPKEDSRELLTARIARAQENVDTNKKIVDKLTTALLMFDNPRGTSVPKEQWGVHETHCCIDCGCKYGDERCPVVKNLTKQRYNCEDCGEDVE